MKLACLRCLTITYCTSQESFSSTVSINKYQKVLYKYYKVCQLKISNVLFYWWLGRQVLKQAGLSCWDGVSFGLWVGTMSLLSCQAHHEILASASVLNFFFHFTKKKKDLINKADQANHCNVPWLRKAKRKKNTSNQAYGGQHGIQQHSIGVNLVRYKNKIKFLQKFPSIPV